MTRLLEVLASPGALRVTASAVLPFTTRNGKVVQAVSIGGRLFVSHELMAQLQSDHEKAAEALVLTLPVEQRQSFEHAGDRH